QTPLGTARRWIVAARLFALPASTMPVIFGTAAAVTTGGAVFHSGLFLAALLAMVLLHTGANMLSDVTDFNAGLDREATPVSGAIVRGYLTDRQVRRAAILLLIIGSLIGLWLVRQVGLPLLWIGLAGVLIGVSYTLGPALKYHALGDLAVFLDFGILGAVGAWTVQTGHPSFLPALWAVPMSLLVVGILHANNWRDIATDRERAGITTVAALLGDRGSLVYYGVLIFAPFILVTLLVGAGRCAAWGLPWPTLLVWLAFPMALGRWRKARRRASPAQPMDFITLDGATAQLNLAFGLLCTAGFVIYRIIGRGL
ncbi:MAG: prenyltransferase, partial [Verrucomicrobia bacterium]|nr:prenyltransferase [Verrucomicrobiota bacterium]